MSVDRVPPSNLEAEQAVLGGLLVTPDLVDDVAQVLRAEDFHSPLHATTFAAIVALRSADAPIDKVAVAEELRRRGVLDKVGGSAYLSSLLEVVPTASSSAYYARIVREKARLRALITAGAKIAACGYDGEDDVEAAVAQAEAALSAATSAGNARATDDAETALARIVTGLVTRKEIATVLRTPWPRLNAYTGGFIAGELVVIPAPPGVGKSVLLANLAEYHASTYGPVLVASLEMGVETWQRRRLAMRTGVSVRAQRTGELESVQRQRLLVAAREIAAVPVEIVDGASREIPTLARHAREIRSRHGALSAICVDHIGRVGEVRADNARVTKHERKSEALLRLTDLAESLGVPIFVADHLNAEGQKAGRPSVATLAFLRDGGNASAHAHHIIVPYREDPIGRPTVGELVVIKSRDGATGSVPCYFDGARALWQSLRETPGQQVTAEPIAPWFEQGRATAAALAVPPAEDPSYFGDLYSAT